VVSGELDEVVEKEGLANCLQTIGDNCENFERLCLTLERPQLVPVDVVDILTQARGCLLVISLQFVKLIVLQLPAFGIG
jgi:hypothetical protein